MRMSGLHSRVDPQSRAPGAARGHGAERSDHCSNPTWRRPIRVQHKIAIRFRPLALPRLDRSGSDADAAGHNQRGGTLWGEADGAQTSAHGRQLGHGPKQGAGPAGAHRSPPAARPAGCGCVLGQHAANGGGSGRGRFLVTGLGGGVPRCACSDPAGSPAASAAACPCHACPTSAAWDARIAGAKAGWKFAWQTMVRELAPQDDSGQYVRQQAAFQARIGTPDFPVGGTPFAQPSSRLHEGCP